MNNHILDQYRAVRKHSENICSPLQKEDYVVQPVVDVSPPKWHLGHTTWFFETFVLKQYQPGYKEFHDQYNFVFNSYYESVGTRVIRTDRGNLSRPSVDDIYAYRSYVDSCMETLLSSKALDEQLAETITLGLNHEQQHQELLITDIKYILGHNPLFPAYNDRFKENSYIEVREEFTTVASGIYEIGFQGGGFCFDNELGRHKVYLDQFSIAKNLVSNGAYLEFIKAGNYQDFRHWHSEGWAWVNENNITSPLYWHLIDGEWHRYSLNGLVKIDEQEALSHVSFYEAAAFASWKGMRLPTEAEWEVASAQFSWGQRWEWTNSAYLPYPGFKKAAGAIGEYNGKFMVSQMVLRGASVATSEGHSRSSYRNFFHAPLRWQFTGIRLAQ